MAWSAAARAAAKASRSSGGKGGKKKFKAPGMSLSKAYRSSFTGKSAGRSVSKTIRVSVTPKGGNTRLASVALRRNRA